MPRKAQVKVQSATSTNTKLALATAALLIASGLAFIAAPSVRGPGAQAKCGLNSFEFRGQGTAHGTCYSGKKVTAYIRGAEPQTLSTNLTAQCLAECLNCPAGYEAVAGKDSDCLISCVKAKPQPKKKAVKKSGRKSSRKSDPVMMAQDAVGSCTDQGGNPLSAPNDGAGTCRGHDGSPNDYIWKGPGPEAESEYCPSNPDDAAPCTYRCPTGQRVNPETGICGCAASQYTDEYGNCLEENDCDSFRLVINRVDRTCLPPEEDEPEEPPMQISGQIAPGMCVGPDGSPSQYPTSDSYSGDIRSCQNGGRPEPGQNSQWAYDANCSTNQACTFQCGEGLILNEQSYCEPCASGFTPNEDNTACTCQDSPGRRVVFHGENTYGITVCETCPSNSLSITYADGSIGCVTQNRCTATWGEGRESRYNFGGTVNGLTCECENGTPRNSSSGCPQ